MRESFRFLFRQGSSSTIGLIDDRTRIKLCTDMQVRYV